MCTSVPTSCWSTRWGPDRRPCSQRHGPSKYVVELTVQAGLTGSRDRVYQAALLDPNTSATLTTDQTVALCDELLEAHRGLLPATLRP